MSREIITDGRVRPLPKLCGADIELGNFEAGVERSWGTGYEASRALLAEIDGFPERPRSLFDAYRPGPHTQRWEKATRAGGLTARRPSGSNPQEVGRRFLSANGGCAYIDLDHLELCISEVVSAFDHVAAWHGMLRIAREALHRANADRRDRRIQVLVNNSDGLGNSYGSHLSFLISRRAWENIFFFKPHYLLFLAAFQISALPLTGSGKVGAENGRSPVPFQISQRADFFELVQSLNTTFNRGVVNSRYEPLCGCSTDAETDGLARLHVIFFDSALAHGSALLRVGLMQLILTLIELGHVNARLILDDPLHALEAYSRDPTLKTTARLIGGERMTALELQHAFLEEIERHATRGVFDSVVPRAWEIISLWEDTLGKLSRGDLVSLAPRLDWVMKLMAIERAMDEDHALSWSSPEAKMLDLMYSSLDSDGLYFAYQAGGFAETLVTEERIGYFAANPPADTRAWTRAMLLRRAASEGICVDSVNWDRITFRMRGRYGGPVYRTVELANPLGLTQADAGALFAEHEEFGALLEALQSLAADARGTQSATAIDNRGEGEENALSRTIGSPAISVRGRR